LFIRDLLKSEAILLKSTNLNLPLLKHDDRIAGSLDPSTVVVGHANVFVRAVTQSSEKGNELRAVHFQATLGMIVKDTDTIGVASSLGNIEEMVELLLFREAGSAKNAGTPGVNGNLKRILLVIPWAGRKIVHRVAELGRIDEPVFRNRIGESSVVIAERADDCGWRNAVPPQDFLPFSYVDVVDLLRYVRHVSEAVELNVLIAILEVRDPLFSMSP